MQAVKRMGPRAMEDEVLATAHALAAALQSVGAMDRLTRRDLDQLCLPPRPDQGGAGQRKRNRRRR